MSEHKQPQCNEKEGRRVLTGGHDYGRGRVDDHDREYDRHVSDHESDHASGHGINHGCGRGNGRESGSGPP